MKCARRPSAGRRRPPRAPHRRAAAGAARAPRRRAPPGSSAAVRLWRRFAARGSLRGLFTAPPPRARRAALADARAARLRSVYVGNLSWGVTEDDLQDFMMGAGCAVNSAKVMRYPDGRSKVRAPRRASGSAARRAPRAAR